MVRRRVVPACPRSTAAAVALALGGALALTGVATPAAHAATGFSPGDVVVYRTGGGASTLGSAGAPVFLDDYSSTGTLRSSVPLPTTTSGANKALVAAGTATSEGGLTLSADGRYLVATGYNAAVGTASLTSSAAAGVPRTVARVDASGAVDSSTALTDFSDGNNPRSAASSDGSSFYLAGAAGSVRYATLGATTSTALTSTTLKNNRQVEIVGGRLYTDADPTKAGTTVATVGTGLPTSGTQTVTNLTFDTAPTQPYQYSFLTLGSTAGTGTAPDTLYVADNSAGAVLKYVLVNGTWTQRGSTAVSGVVGVTANDAGGTVSIYASSTNSAGTSGTLSLITDTGGLAGSLSASATPANTIATAPSNEAFRGVAFAPGTTIGSGGGTGGTAPPTIATNHAGLPAAINDTNPTLTVTVGDAAYDAGQLTLSATSSNPTVAPASGLSLTGTGATRTLAVTPGAVGRSTITLTVSAPDGTSATTTVAYGVSSDLGNTADRYLTGAGNASAAIDLGNGYLLTADDENNVIRLYDTSSSGPPVKTFDFTSVLPQGVSEIDLEGASRSGNTIYFEGSMSNNSSGVKQSSRSTLFAVTVAGTGANTTLTYVGAYSGLQSDLVAWDDANGHGLGAKYLGLDASVNGGVDSHEKNALNLEGFEFAGSSSSTAYLGLRAPLEPTTDRHLALVVPVTNVDKLVTGAASTATFGAPLFWDLGGYGVRDLKENADGQYLIIAGSADDSNTDSVLYTWDGNPAHQPVQTGTTLPNLPSDSAHGSWETVVSVPDPLTTGSSVRLIQDDGDLAWYGDGATTKTNLPPDLAKSIERTFTYTAPAPSTTTTTLTSSDPSAVIGEQVTYTSTSTSAVARGVLTGTVAFGDGGTTITGCATQPIGTDGTATCVVTYAHAGSHTVTATYAGDSTYAASTSSSLTQGVQTWAPVLTGAQAGDALVALTFQPPASGPTPTGYVVTETEGDAVGQTTTVAAGATTARITGLQNGTEYAFTVAALNGSARGDASAASVPVTPRVVAGEYVPLAPARILDTRQAADRTGGQPMGAGADDQLTLPVLGRGGVPSSGVTAVVINLTGVDSTQPTYLTALTDPVASYVRSSNLNFTSAAAKAVQVTVPVAADGSITFYNAYGTVDVVVDVEGYYQDDSGFEAGRVHAEAPQRLLDTRDGTGVTGGTAAPVAAGSPLDVQVTGNAGVPSGATAVILDLTGVRPTQDTYLTAFAPTGGNPGTSSVNVSAGTVVGNLVTVPLSASGRMRIADASGSVDLVADVSGWVGPASDASGSHYVAVDPHRVLDTRIGPGPVGRVGAGQTVETGVDAPSGATGVLVGLTSVYPSTATYLSVGPAGSPAYYTSSLNSAAGQVTSNAALALLGSDSAVTQGIGVTLAQGDDDVLVDVQGYFVP